MGTVSYMAPEQHEYNIARKYDGNLSDVFSLGLILFIMVFGSPPFRKAVKHDRWYLPIQIGKFNLFWRNALSGKNDPKTYISQDLIELITAMLQHNPDDRVSLDDITKTPWFNQE